MVPREIFTHFTYFWKALSPHWKVGLSSSAPPLLEFDQRQSWVRSKTPQNDFNKWVDDTFLSFKSRSIHHITKTKLKVSSFRKI